MIKFIGKYNVKIDDKGRVVFPSAFKSVMLSAGDLRLVVRKDIFEPCLEMYSYSEWERQSEEVKAKLDFFNRDHARFWRAYMANRAEVRPDDKIGRILIPKELLDSIGATKELIFAGNDHKIEIWAKENFDSSEVSQDEMISLAASLSRK